MKPVKYDCICCGEPCAVGSVAEARRLDYCCAECHEELRYGTVPDASTLQRGTGGGTRVIRSGKEMS